METRLVQRRAVLKGADSSDVKLESRPRHEVAVGPTLESRDMIERGMGERGMGGTDARQPESGQGRPLEVEARGRETPVARETPVTNVEAKSAANPKGRNRLRIFLLSGGILAAAIAAGAFWLSGGRIISTDNAYVRAAKLMVSTDVSGLVAAVQVHEGEAVRKGDVLFRLDNAQYEIALQAADAQLALVKINLAAARQDYARLLSDIGAQEAQLELAKTANDRANTLFRSDAGTKAALDQTRLTFATSQKQAESLRIQARSALTRLGGDLNSPIEQLPQYIAAKAQTDEARRQLDHTLVRAPFAGVVTAVDHLQPGAYLVSQTAALTNTGAVGLVATDNLWVDANFKETDLTFAKAGDPVTIYVDAYPGVTWRGRVASIAPASGSEFSILPAQNSSGNWVKVVQRLPVRIALDAAAPGPQLRSGMSVVADIDTGHVRKFGELWRSAPPPVAKTSPATSSPATTSPATTSPNDAR